jgi:PAS domain S-box-containing protein
MKQSVFTQKQPVVLIVDDDETLQAVMLSSLEAEGLTVELASSGEEALQAFPSLRPDIVILDVMMPGMDGFETYAALRKLPGGENTPIIMITAIDDIDCICRAYAIGATDFITKPMKLPIFTHRVKYILRATKLMKELATSEARLENAQRMARLGHWEWHTREDAFFCSTQICRIAGLPSAEAVPTFEAFLDLIHPEDKTLFREAIDATRQGQKPLNLEHRLLAGDGTIRFVYHQAEALSDPKGSAVHMMGTLQDITDRKEAEKKIRHLAYYDELTSLPNRTFFKKHLDQALKLARHHGRIAGVLMLDLDDFKRVNETFGHAAGDQFLKDVSERLSRFVRINDIVSRPGCEEMNAGVSRFGGDEFTLLLSEIRRAEDAARVARRILKVLSEPFRLNGQDLVLTASAGIALFPHDGDDMDTLLKHADIAMYHAKSRGRNNCQFYTQSMNAESFERLSLENDLRKALDSEELLLHYQPILDINSRKLTGMEALVRWNHPTRGMVLPAEFIPLAEERGLIGPIGEWVLRTACTQNKLWQHAGHAPVTVSVNLSHRQFEDPNLYDVVANAVQASGLVPEYLVLELTESTTMKNAESTIASLNKFKELGIRLSVDDFGTGYSSLSCLRRFPLDVLKVDRSFVREITTNADQTEITKAIIALARPLRLKVIAEGVETEEQLVFLRALGCDAVQGFLFSPPVAPDAFARFFTEASVPAPPEVDQQI